MYIAHNCLIILFLNVFKTQSQTQMQNMKVFSHGMGVDRLTRRSTRFSCLIQSVYLFSPQSRLFFLSCCMLSERCSVIAASI